MLGKKQHKVLALQRSAENTRARRAIVCIHTINKKENMCVQGGDDRYSSYFSGILFSSKARGYLDIKKAAIH